MICVSIKHIDEKKYKKLLLYCLSVCNRISFHFPGVYDNASVLPSEMWKNYHAEVAKIKAQCFRNGAKREVSKHYYGMKLGTYSIILTVYPFEYLKSLLLKNHLFDWLVENNLPEDVCFLSDNTLRIFSCSHEEDFFIYNETSADIAFLRENAFDFWQHK